MQPPRRRRARAGGIARERTGTAWYWLAGTVTWSFVGPLLWAVLRSLEPAPDDHGGAGLERLRRI